ncbi:MAG TPA: phosphate signaling complex protein PhoU [Steroidobacteraceae bacterium]|jgi:phosphate transport system protein|nr:phosphate signaling complex protein PhoU [Steroidobacteraceae bacterium]
MGDEAPLLEGHISRAFDGDLAALQMRVVAMGGLVLSQVQTACHAYAHWLAEDARLVTSREPQVNALELEIDEDAQRVIARRQPVASDLRAVMAIERVLTDLERMGDEANKIARLVLVDARRSGSATGSAPGAATARDVRQLGRLAAVMVRAAVEAFDRLDAAGAELVVQRDAELDSEYAAGLRRLLSRAMEDPRRLQHAVEAAFVLKSIERVGDHARNLALQVIYLVRGDSARAARAAALVGHPP